MKKPTENELVVLGYFNVGLATEAHGAKAKLYKMDWAGTGGSGVSVGVAQHDFYANRNTVSDSKNFVSAYNQWASANHQKAFQGSELETAASVLRNTVGQSLPIEYKTPFNAFLDTPTGQAYILEKYDVARYQKNAQALLDIYDNSSYLRAIPQDKADETMSMLLKYANQGGFGDIQHFFDDRFFNEKTPKAVAGVQLKPEDLQNPEVIFDKLKQVFVNASQKSVIDGRSTIVTLEAKDALKADEWSKEVWPKFNTPQFLPVKQYLIETLDFSGVKALADIKPKLDVMRSLYRDFDFHSKSVDLNGSKQPFVMNNDGLGHSIKFNGQTNEFTIKYKDGTQYDSASKQLSGSELYNSKHSLDDTNQQHKPLIASAEQHTQRLFKEAGLDFANGGANTVASVTLLAAKHNITEIEHMNVKDGRIEIAQKDPSGFGYNTASIDAVQAANTDKEQSLQALNQLSEQQSMQMQQTQHKAQNIT